MPPSLLLKGSSPPVLRCGKWEVGLGGFRWGQMGLVSPGVLCDHCSPPLHMVQTTRRGAFNTLQNCNPVGLVHFIFPL